MRTYLQVALDYLSEIMSLISSSSSSISSSSFAENSRSHTMYSFKPHRLVKLETTGNQIRNMKCPSPRSGHRLIVEGGNVYSFGGYNPIAIGDAIEHILFKELWIYNYASKTWKFLKTTGITPDELASHCAARVNDCLLIFGGTAYPFGSRSSNHAHICNLETLEWTRLKTTGCPPTKQYGQAMVVHENKMYVIGGTTGYVYSNEVHCLDLTTLVWKHLDVLSNPSPGNIPPPRYRHEIAVMDNKMYVFGGGTGTTCFDLKDLPVFNMNNNTWAQVSTKGPCPLPRRCHSCVQVEDDVYICGGLDGLTSYSDIWKINLKTLVWTDLKVSLPSPLYFHAAALSNENQLFVFGGVTGQENERTNDMYTMWLKVPSLTSMCWDAVLHYIPNLASYDKRVLFEAGIPLRCLSEVEFYSSDVPEVTDSYSISHIGLSDESWEVM